MDTNSENVYRGAQSLLKRFREQLGDDALPQEVFQVQDLIECIEKNADRVAHMMKDTRRKRSGASWDDIKALLVEQDRYFREVSDLFVQMSKKKLVVSRRAAP